MPLFATNTFRSLLDSFFNFFHDPNVVPREIITISSHQQGPGPSQPRRTNPVTLLPYPAPPRYISGFIELDQDQATIHGGYNDVSKGHHRTYGAVALRCPRQAANYLISNQSSQVSVRLQPADIPILTNPNDEGLRTHGGALVELTAP
ncbi:hypothetical protein FRB99_000423 [Tulasnella sp. 403]|nr:hypothetical protein FRB99_000423 [Tulasnella sp. 403]